MTTVRDLVQIIFDTVEQGTNRELADLVSTTPEYMSRITRILFDNDILDRFRDGRSYVYFLNPEREDQYKEFTYTIRILGTNKKDRRGVHAWETDQTLDSTIKGIVPINFTEEMVKAKIHDDLFNEMRTIMTDKGIMVEVKNDGSVGVDDEDIISGDGLDGISGVEFGRTVQNYDPNVEIEVVYTNKEGIT